MRYVLLVALSLYGTTLGTNTEQHFLPRGNILITNKIDALALFAIVSKIDGDIDNRNKRIKDIISKRLSAAIPEQTVVITSGIGYQEKDTDGNVRTTSIWGEKIELFIKLLKIETAPHHLTEKDAEDCISLADLKQIIQPGEYVLTRTNDGQIVITKK